MADNSTYRNFLGSLTTISIVIISLGMIVGGIIGLVM